MVMNAGPVKVVLGPMLLWQGHRVRRQVLKLPEAQGPRCGEVGAPGAPCRLRLLVVGDSAAAGVGVSHQDQAMAGPLARRLAQALGVRVRWQVVATTGHTAADAVRALRNESVLWPADLMITSIGVNDVVGQTPPGHWLSQLDALHALAVERAGVRRTWHSAVPSISRFPLLPQPLRWVLGRDGRRLDQALRLHLRDHPDRGHVPLPVVPPRGGAGWMAADGFHPSEVGYRVWVDALVQTLMRDGVHALLSAPDEAAAEPAPRRVVNG